jgi:hypothetical protein
MGASHLERRPLLFFERETESAGAAAATASAAAAQSIIQMLANPLRRMLMSLGLVEECLPGHERVLFTALAVLVTVAVLAVEWRRRVQTLSRRLREAEASVRYLNDELHTHPTASYPKKEIRIFMVRHRGPFRPPLPLGFSTSAIWCLRCRAVCVARTAALLTESILL